MSSPQDQTDITDEVALELRRRLVPVWAELLGPEYAYVVTDPVHVRQELQGFASRLLEPVENPELPVNPRAFSKNPLDVLLLLKAIESFYTMVFDEEMSPYREFASFAVDIIKILDEYVHPVSTAQLRLGSVTAKAAQIFAELNLPTRFGSQGTYPVTPALTDEPDGSIYVRP